MDSSQISQKKECDTLAQRLRERYRNSLSQLGLSRDAHLTDVDLSYINTIKNRSELSFIRDVRRFYEKLDPLDQLLFNNEYLESGRHYIYWWTVYFSFPDYRNARLEMTKQILEGLGGHLYGIEA